MCQCELEHDGEKRSFTLINSKLSGKEFMNQLQEITKYQSSTKFESMNHASSGDSMQSSSWSKCKWEWDCDDYVGWENGSGKLNSCEENAIMTDSKGNSKTFRGKCKRGSCDGDIPKNCGGKAWRKGQTCWDKCEKTLGAKKAEKTMENNRETRIYVLVSVDFEKK